MSYEIAEILDGAADAIEHDGWWAPGAPIFGSLCASNAIARVGMERYGPHAMLAAHDALLTHAEIPGSRLGGIWDWNDAPGRTEQEVLDALRLAAKQERILADGIGGDAA